MTKKQSIRLALAVVLIALALVLRYMDWIPAPPPGASIIPTPTAASASVTPTPGHGGELVTVVSVVDGDTIKIEGGEVVRYIGMNTPETVAPGRPIECYGKEASVKNKELVLGKTVELEKDVSDRDKYGRLLRYIWIGDEMVNETLVREGYAQVSTYPPDVKHQPQFVEAQRLAKEEARGLWSSTCPQITPTLRPTKSATPSATISPEVF